MTNYFAATRPKSATFKGQNYGCSVTRGRNIKSLRKLPPEDRRHPPVGGLTDFAEVPEQVKIEQLVAISPVKAFNIGILVGFPGLDVVDHHPGGFRPSREFTTQKLRAVIIPVIASSGAGKPEHFAEVFTATGVEAALAAGIFHRHEVAISAVKQYLRERGIETRS